MVFVHDLQGTKTIPTSCNRSNNNKTVNRKISPTKMKKMAQKNKSQEKNKMCEIDEKILKYFDIKKRLGKGAYGVVWKAIDRKTSQIIAVKKIFDAFRNETDAQRTFREIMFLKAFRSHPNVIQLHSIHKATNNLDIYLAFEYMESDLHNVIKRGSILKDIHKRYIMYQLFNAIKYIHSGNVIHRDLKPSNVLIDSKCRCKIADFGLARSVSNRPTKDTEELTEVILTDYVATRWYRAPEILIASRKYTKGIDMWSLGCILGEMIRGKPLFPGSSTVNQIEKICASLPEITQKELISLGSSFGSALLNQQIDYSESPSLEDLLKGSTDDAKSLVKSLLVMDPKARLTASEALSHKYIEKFRHSISEVELKTDVLPPLRDDVQLTVPEYRTKLYEIIQQSIISDRGMEKPAIPSNNTTRQPTTASSSRRKDSNTNTSNTAKLDRISSLVQQRVTPDEKLKREYNSQIFTDKKSQEQKPQVLLLQQQKQQLQKQHQQLQQVKQQQFHEQQSQQQQVEQQHIRQVHLKQQKPQFQQQQAQVIHQPQQLVNQQQQQQQLQRQQQQLPHPSAIIKSYVHQSPISCRHININNNFSNNNNNNNSVNGNACKFFVSSSSNSSSSSNKSMKNDGQTIPVCRPVLLSNSKATLPPANEPMKSTTVITTKSLANRTKCYRITSSVDNCNKLPNVTARSNNTKHLDENTNDLKRSSSRNKICPIRRYSLDNGDNVNNSDSTHLTVPAPTPSSGGEQLSRRSNSCTKITTISDHNNNYNNINNNNKHNMTKSNKCNNVSETKFMQDKELVKILKFRNIDSLRFSNEKNQKNINSKTNINDIIEIEDDDNNDNSNYYEKRIQNLEEKINKHKSDIKKLLYGNEKYNHLNNGTVNDNKCSKLNLQAASVLAKNTLIQNIREKLDSNSKNLNIDDGLKLQPFSSQTCDITYNGHSKQQLQEQHQQHHHHHHQHHNHHHHKHQQHGDGRMVNSTVSVTVPDSNTTSKHKNNYGLCKTKALLDLRNSQAIS